MNSLLIHDNKRTIIQNTKNRTASSSSFRRRRKRRIIKIIDMEFCRVSMTIAQLIFVLQLMLLIANYHQPKLVTCQQPQQQQQPQKNNQHLSTTSAFPGVSKDLASFCAGRPSLPIDLASMIVHVKRNVSFNYKLYLFSSDYVFQTGQIIPRDMFRVHSFPVKMKRFQDFWPSQNLSGVNNQFDLKEFFRLVPLNDASGRKLKQRRLAAAAPHDAGGDPLPGDDYKREPFISHDDDHDDDSNRTNQKRQTSASRTSDDMDLNKFIEFDRDDQISRLNAHPGGSSSSSSPMRSSPSIRTSEFLSTSQHRQKSTHSNTARKQQQQQLFEQLVLPVGSFSSFHVNLTYLVRKDFDQLEPQLLKVLVDANKFQVSHWELISDGQTNSSSSRNEQANLRNEDFAFLSHKLLNDLNTRITSINQIYEDWITRNFYTIVYVQRRLFINNEHNDDDDDGDLAFTGDSEEVESGDSEGSRTTATRRTKNKKTIKKATTQLINDRLIFRGSSMSLLGAEQLDYQVKASAFITEKNGLHYYLEFLNTGKFYLCAIDWSKRPFKIIDWQQFPMKATRTQFDNEELLLCPPAVCYSNQPIDEIVSYGRLNLPEQIERQIGELLSSRYSTNSTNHHNNKTLYYQDRKQNNHHQLTDTPIDLSSNNSSSDDGSSLTSAALRLRGRDAVVELTNSTQKPDLNQIIEAVKIAAAAAISGRNGGSGGGGNEQQQVAGAIKLHLRDWLWTLEPITSSSSSRKSEPDSLKPGTSTQTVVGSSYRLFKWRYELAKRNDIKAKPDAYGYTLTGHEIDASYRIYNELYLISANYLIAINYTLANETVVSSILVSEEFPGLISTLFDPITGAFYDRYTNRLYFFKGDRYIGFDYATKKPLEEFILKPSYLHSALMMGPELMEFSAEAEADGTATTTTTTTGNTMANNSDDGPALLFSQPVVGLLGRQHQVDGIYHDFATDLVYIFTGMKFYTFHANEFKDGVFKRKTGSEPSPPLPQMYCINERFLNGCNFDKAYPNPCQHDDVVDATAHQSAKLLHHDDNDAGDDDAAAVTIKESSKNFNQEQQMKLRSIASKAGLLNVLVENSLIGKGIQRTLEPLVGGAGADTTTTTVRDSTSSGRDQEKLMIYLLMAIVLMTILITIVMILVMIRSNSRSRSSTKTSRAQQAVLDQLKSTHLPRHNSLNAQKILTKPHQIAQVKQSSSNRYLSNHHQYLRPYQIPTATINNHRQLSAGSSFGSATKKPVGTVSVVMSKGRQIHRDNVIDNSAL